MNRKIVPAQKISGEVFPPGDKSISHRALVIAGIAGGTSTIYNLSPAEDVCSTINCLRQLGVKIRIDKSRAIVTGKGLRGLSKPRLPLNCGNSGTTMRLLAGVLAGQKFTSTLTGDSSLKKRPMDRIAVPLRLMGARVDLSPGCCAPFSISGGDLRPLNYSMPLASAQVKSAILLAGLYSNGVTSVKEIFPTRNHTENLLSIFGIKVKIDRGGISIIGGQGPEPAEVSLPGDFSSAAPWIAAACLIPGGDVRIAGVLLNPTRLGLLAVLKRMGAKISVTRLSGYEEPCGMLEAVYSPLHGTTVKKEEIPLMIDELPLLALVAAQAKGVTRINGAVELKYKESDRLADTARVLNRMGADVKIKEDGFVIKGGKKLKGGLIDAGKDHRIIMMAGVAALTAAGSSTIKNSQYVSISYPSFFADMRHLMRG